ncbi:hypothetical protein B0A50_00872 [Salinomyces thailandicus]|uniref:Uncharacterized protein n=1 Tax=Salinomyces thailandicus TaxID=706561 RepID=A0A4V5N6N9_9PEZI|nr:hypothetical protein B0A50_00872 [Salinomyces thailandica]
MSPLSTSPIESAANLPGMPAKLRSLVQAPKVDISIRLASRKTVYTTLDKIEGVASLTAPVDTRFDDVEVEFVGTGRTFVERLTTAAAVSGRSEAFHQFLKLTQPGLEARYPEDKVLKAGQTYDFPFVFAVPQQLLPRICQHKVQSPAVRDAHLQLPPTLGDKDSNSQNGGLDDMAPDMASVRYGVFAKVTKMKITSEETIKVSLASKARKLRISPAVDEQPPLDAGGDGSEYTLRKEKTLRKGMLKGKLGTLVMEALQPPSLRMKPNHDPDTRTTTMATVLLRFDPADESAQPPRLGTMSSKLKVSTYFSSTARQSFPSKSASLLDLSQGLHSEQLNLSSRCMGNVEWTKTTTPKPPTVRRDSATSLSPPPPPSPLSSDKYKGKSYYTARLLIPIMLPTTSKTFVPTFHSCLISRQYALKLDLTIPGTGGIAPSMDLRLPLQVSQEGRPEDVSTSPERVPVPRDAASSTEDADADAEAEEEDGESLDAESAYDFFEPRSMRRPSESPVRRSRLGSTAPTSNAEYEAPPGYTALPPGAQMVPRRGRGAVAVH